MNKSLKAEIDHLTGKLDKIIVEQAGMSVFRCLDTVRKLSKNARHRGSEASRLAKLGILNRLDMKKACQVAHAFSLFFQLVNLCEERARERQLRTRKMMPMSLPHLFSELKQAGVT